jgi:DNA-binding NarL/FixJ family response regulator
MNLAQLAFTGHAMTAQVAMPREPQDLTAREIDQAVALFRDGLNRKQIAAQMSKDLQRKITENMISIAFMARGVNKNDWRK